MGQRLIIEFRSAGKFQVGTYQHWSGYTRSALETLSKIYSELCVHNKIISALEAIGMREYPNGDRNTGLYTFSEEQFEKDLVPYADMFLTVDLDEMTFDCDSCFSLHCQDDDEEVDRTNTTVLGCQTIANLEDAGVILSEVCAGYDTIFEFPDSNDAFEEI